MTETNLYSTQLQKQSVVMSIAFICLSTRPCGLLLWKQFWSCEVHKIWNFLRR